MAVQKDAGKLGRFLQGVVEELRLTTSQGMVLEVLPPHISTLEKPLMKKV